MRRGPHGRAMTRFISSAKAELRFAIARKLGLSPKSLFHDEVEFVWKDEARFKHLSNETDEQKSALTSFGMSICRILMQATQVAVGLDGINALELRKSILQNKPFVDLLSLLATCWAIGLPVIHLRVFPLEAKRMHAMAVKVANRHAILLGRDAQYPASLAFTLAHEIGHVMLGHIASSWRSLTSATRWRCRGVTGKKKMPTATH